MIIHTIMNTKHAESVLLHCMDLLAGVSKSRLACKEHTTLKPEVGMVHQKR